MSTPDLTQTPIDADGNFEVHLQKSGQTLRVGKEQSILSALQDAGHEVRSAIRVLLSKADKAPLVEEMERIRIDIYVRDNIP